MMRPFERDTPKDVKISKSILQSQSAGNSIWCHSTSWAIGRPGEACGKADRRLYARACGGAPRAIYATGDFGNLRRIFLTLPYMYGTRVAKALLTGNWRRLRMDMCAIRGCLGGLRLRYLYLRRHRSTAPHQAAPPT